jgi:hypothetical protein
MDIIMNKDIVTEMVQQMGLTPQMADQLQNQQAGMANYSGGPGPGGPGLPATPEEQMRLMEAAQNPRQYQQPPMQQEYPEEESETEDTDSSASTESDVDLDKVGLNSPSKGLMDSIMDYLRDPLIVMVLFVILSLSQVSDMIRKMLPAIITGNTYYLLGVKALIMGSSYLTTKLVIT